MNEHPKLLFLILLQTLTQLQLLRNKLTTVDQTAPVATESECCSADNECIVLHFDGTTSISPH